MVVGLDIGGANIKVSDGGKRSYSKPFPLWQQKDLLGEALKQILGEFASDAPVAVTMTGELADCFESKEEGVRYIVDTVVDIAGNDRVSFYSVAGRFVSAAEAKSKWRYVAAANWHALASIAAQLAAMADGVVIDVGSTTTDIIPVMDGYVTAKALEDRGRLLTGELVYSGVGRTPVCSLVDTVKIGKVPCPVAKEFFASTCDVYLITGDLPENSQSFDSADGRPNTKKCASQRLARMVCSDSGDFSTEEIESIAKSVKRVQFDEIANAIEKVDKANELNKPDVVVCGTGAFLARQVLAFYFSDSTISDFSELTGDRQHSFCAAAYAVARLLRESQITDQIFK